MQAAFCRPWPRVGSSHSINSNASAHSGALSALHLEDDALHDACADPQRATDLENAHAFRAEASYALLNSRCRTRAAERCPLLPGARKPGVDTFANDAPLKLGKDAQHLKHCSAGGGRRVEALLMQKQIHALVAERLQDGQQIRERASEASGFAK